MQRSSLKSVTWRNFTCYCPATESRFIKWNLLYLAARRRILHLSVRARISVLFTYFFFFFFVIFWFSFEQKLCNEQKAWRRTFQLTSFRQSSASVVSPSATSSSPRRSIQYQLKIVASSLYGPSAEATYKFYCLSELLNLINFALILSLPLL